MFFSNCKATLWCCYAAGGRSPITSGPPDHLRQILLPQMVPLGQLWLLWMVCFADGPPTWSFFPSDNSDMQTSKHAHTETHCDRDMCTVNCIKFHSL